ncbi:hypothetical protein Asp14428_51360 [Actinoplanes sp. NBRC 14428]|nr:hypothetical protein Asp14428_51360 [Actinoplanes sp. NBRC 14428]
MISPTSHAQRLFPTPAEYADSEIPAGTTTAADPVHSLWTTPSTPVDNLRMPSEERAKKPQGPQRRSATDPAEKLALP